MTPVTVFAHRGASAREPENTMAAFAEARRLGTAGIELDVRRTRDGALAVHHDAALADGRFLCQLDAAALPASVPLLGAVLAAFDDLVLNVEMKDLPGEPGYLPSYPLAALVAAAVRDSPARRVLVSSFDLMALDALRALDPDLATGWLTATGYDQAAAVELLVARGHRALHPRHEAVTAGLVADAHDRGLAVNTWTVDDPAQVRALAANGVDGIITNVPDVALAALAEG